MNFEIIGFMISLFLFGCVVGIYIMKLLRVVYGEDNKE